MASSIQDLLGFTPLTKLVETLPDGIPNILGEAVPKIFSTTEQFPGNRFSRTTYAGTRKLARNVPYMGAAKSTPKQNFGIQDLQALSPKEKIEFNDEFLRLYREFDRYEMQKSRALEIIKKQTAALKSKMMDFKIAAVHSLFGQAGKIHLDIDGYMLPSSAGVDNTIDNQIPAANIGNVGGFFTASWATATTDILTSVLNFKTFARQQCSRMMKYAFYGKNVASYIVNNDYFQPYLMRNPQMNNQYVNSGVIPDGFLGLTWVPMQDTFYEDAAGTIRELFPADQITFTPEIEESVWSIYQGTTPVPKRFGLQNSPDAANDLGGLFTEHPGMASYTFATIEPISIAQYMVDCFLPNFKVPNAFFFVDVTP